MKNKITLYGFLLQTTKENKAFSLVGLCSRGWMHVYILHLAMIISLMNSALYHECTWFVLKAKYDVVLLDHARS